VDAQARPLASAPAPAPLRWGEESLWETLQPVLPGCSVEVVAELGSTNTRLLERARHADADLSPCLLVAERQTAGRGRLGRAWMSAPGHSLTFSLGLPMAPVHWGGLSLAVGVALAEALEPVASVPRLALKWPNDLWLRDDAAPAGGRKLGGILIETVAVSRERLVVVGVGLNVGAAPADAAGAALSHGYAGLHELLPTTTAPAALARVAVPLVQALKRFEREGFAPFAAAYARRDLLQGRAVTVSGGVELDGQADGVDVQGALRVLAGGQCHRVVSGEASVRLTAPT
jgi:BirA family biotin operon repressor/biotin-[acetyl-CoA-carboxylase] ligase